MVLTLALVENRYQQILHFVKEADSVVTYVTYDYPLPEKFQFFTSASTISQCNRKNPKSKFVRFERESFEPPRIPQRGFGENDRRFPSCFMPHHYVYAAKGKKHVRFEICFTCSLLIVDGAYNFSSLVNRSFLDKTEKLFGMKFVPATTIRFHLGIGRDRETALKLLEKEWAIKELL